MRFFKRNPTIGFFLGVAMITTVAAAYWWSQPKTLWKWVKIYPDGSNKTGSTIETSEGRGFEGEPDELPGLVISKGTTDIGLSYRNTSGRELNIDFGKKMPYHYKLNARHIEGGKIWSAQVFENGLSISETSSGKLETLSYKPSTHKMEKHIFIDRNSVPWEGVGFELTPGGSFTITRYHEGKPIFSKENLSINEANSLSDEWSVPADKDYDIFVRDTLKRWQREMAEEMHLPELENEDYASLNARYF